MIDEEKTTADPLDGLANEAATAAAPALGDGVTDLDAAHVAEQPAKLSNEQALIGGLSAARDVFCAFTKLESPKTTLGDEPVQQLAKLWAPVLSKHGIELGSYLGDYALEIAAVIGTFAIAAAVRSGVNAELKAMKQNAKTEPVADAVTEQ